MANRVWVYSKPVHMIGFYYEDGTIHPGYRTVYADFDVRKENFSLFYDSELIVLPDDIQKRMNETFERWKKMISLTDLLEYHAKEWAEEKATYYGLV